MDFSWSIPVNMYYLRILREIKGGGGIKMLIFSCVFIKCTVFQLIGTSTLFPTFVIRTQQLHLSRINESLKLVNVTQLYTYVDCSKKKRRISSVIVVKYQV